MRIEFYIRFSTRYGQSLLVSGNIKELGNSIAENAFPLEYFNNDYWYGSIDVGENVSTGEINYQYIFRKETGEEIIEWGNDRIIDTSSKSLNIITVFDTWNHAGETDNAFYTKPFQEILLSTPPVVENTQEPTKYTHEFRVKAPLITTNEALCVCGPAGTDWSADHPVLMQKQGNWLIARIDLAEQNFPLHYRYGIYDQAENRVTSFENINSRILFTAASSRKLVIIHDGFAVLPNNTWKGAGMAIPVFSLKSKSSFGTGEFNDIKLLVDWAKATGLKLIQLLPINDTTATHTNADSYPYAAISAFALHPLYLNLEKVAGKEQASVIKKLEKKQRQLNKKTEIDYEQVINIKLETIRQLYTAQKETFANDPAYFLFFEMNRHWLVPFAAFCLLRDKYGTSDFTNWKTNSVYDEDAIQQLVSPNQKHYDTIGLHYFTQYHLHRQLKEATDYAHANGIIVKGDIPIGVYRYGCDAWTEPALYHMDTQAGAPPDDFAVKGQNWGFPTYNWEKMQEDGFSWWRKRFEQMSEYFDAFRIDHILGFFRIWSIPLHAVQGIMGKFVPAIAVHVNEFYNRNIQFNIDRFCRPFINDQILYESFGDKTGYIKEQFLEQTDSGYRLKEAFNTQRKIEKYFASNDENESLRDGLFDLCSNIILFEGEGSDGTQFHFRIAMEQTSSFNWLDDHTKHQLKELYVNYFFERQDDFWRTEAMHKLPSLKRSTNMLVCGEDLGMVPHCVPDVMQQLGMLSLEIQRMPKKTGAAFFHPNEAPYLSVVTPGTHDMSTIHGWWEEDREKTQNFYNHILGHYGQAPYFCEPWINKEMIVQHLYSPAIWSVFQLQDLLGMSATLRRENPNEERINVPADPNHRWVYRMHLYLEDLLKEHIFNEELRAAVSESGRGN